MTACRNAGMVEMRIKQKEGDGGTCQKEMEGYPCHTPNPFIEMTPYVYLKQAGSRVETPAGGASIL